ncbi:MAG: hypothetical protein LRY68_01785 [Sulfurospirillum sp.]|nr:hypothetical protein [Sulfurospirillum sp.]
MKKYIGFMVVLIGLLFIGCSSEPKNEAISVVKETYKEGEKVELKSVAGAKLTLVRKNGGFVIEEDEGKIILIDIFGTFLCTMSRGSPFLNGFSASKQ